MDSSAVDMPEAGQIERTGCARLLGTNFFVKNKAYILIYRPYSYWNVKMYCTGKNNFRHFFE